MAKHLMAVAFALAGCDGSNGEIMSADFPTMARCLDGVQTSAGSKIKDTATDEPDRVSGFLTDGRHFACEKKETGTKGTYFNGYYSVK